MNLYDDLNISPDATPDEINAAYRKAAREHHPDAGGDPEAFQRVKNAAMILRDPVKRKRYDKTGEADDTPDNSAAVHVSLMLSAVAQIIDSGMNLTTTDVIGRAENILSKEMIGLSQTRNQFIEMTKRTEQGLKRVTRIDDGPDYIKTMLENRIRDYRKAIADIDEREAVLTEAINLLHSFEWVTETNTTSWTYATTV